MYELFVLTTDPIYDLCNACLLNLTFFFTGKKQVVL